MPTATTSRDCWYLLHLSSTMAAGVSPTWTTTRKRWEGRRRVSRNSRFPFERRPLRNVPIRVVVSSRHATCLLRSSSSHPRNIPKEFSTSLCPPSSSGLVRCSASVTHGGQITLEDVLRGYLEGLCDALCSSRCSLCTPPRPIFAFLASFCVQHFPKGCSINIFHLSISPI